MKKRAVARRSEPVAEIVEAPSVGVSESLLIGRLLRLDGDRVLVELAKDVSGEPVAARSLAAFEPSDLGAELVVLLPAGELSGALVLGAIRSRVERARGPAGLQVAIEADGEKVELRAEKELVLRVGASSITLTRAGKILIRGEYLLSRSSGVNRIKGGSVQIN